MLEWSENLKLNIETIDNQHKEIFNVANRLIQAFEENNDELSQTYEALCFAEEYIRKHFGTEEFYLKKYNYPNLNAHIKMHEAFSKQLDEYKLSWKRAGITKKSAIELTEFLSLWWKNHILNIDSQYVSWISDKIQRET